MKHESGMTMLTHSVLISAVAYFVMIYMLKQNHTLAENRSLILGSCTLIYMILFGHDLPPQRLNPNV